MKYHNNTTLPVEKILAMKVIGRIKNNWRERIVTIYQDPENNGKVYTIGLPFNISQPLIVCYEPINFTYMQAIDLFPVVLQID